MAFRPDPERSRQPAQSGVSWKFVAALAGSLCLWLNGQLCAVQVYGTSGTGSTYTTAPADDFGFANVAKVFDTTDGFYTSGVYLGNGWMISAYHAVRSGSNGFAFGNVILDGSNYSVNASTALRITDPTTRNPADLAMYQLTVAPADANLKTLTVSTLNPNPGSNLILTGNGADRAAALTYWNVDKSASNWIWTESVTGPGNYSGYKYDVNNTQSLRWGNGTMSGTTSSNDGFGVTSFLYSLFQSASGSAIAATGDSGGGVFYKKSGSTWQLTGILLSVGTPGPPYNGQPGGTSIVNNDETYAANLTYYHTQINAVSAVQAPSIITQPNSLTVIEGGTGTFACAAAGTPPPGYQWQRLPVGSGTWSNLTDLAGTYAGTATATLSVSNVGLAMSGDQFRCVAGNGTLPNALSSAANLTVETGYAAWVASYPGPPSAVGGPAATPQNDGIPNAVKYLCAVNPTLPMSAASRAMLPIGAIVTVGGIPYLALAFRQNPNAPGLTLSTQTSPDLTTWTTGTPDLTQTVGTDPVTGDPMIQLGVRINGAQKMFLRLQINIW